MNVYVRYLTNALYVKLCLQKLKSSGSLSEVGKYK